MAFISIDEDNNMVLTKPFMAFVFIAVAVGLGMMLFTLLLYGLIQAITSSGFEELKTTTDGTEDRERIDDNDDLEDV